MAAALLLVDVIKDFRHDDGDRLLASYRERHTALVRTLERARTEGLVVATEMCVFQTVTDGVRAGFGLAVEAGSCATVDTENERLALDYLDRVLGVDVRR